jgi:hypothetical protein
MRLFFLLVAAWGDYELRTKEFSICRALYGNENVLVYHHQGPSDLSQELYLKSYKYARSVGLFPDGPENPKLGDLGVVRCENRNDFCQEGMLKKGDNSIVFAIDNCQGLIASVVQSPFVFRCKSEALGAIISLTLDTAKKSDPKTVFEFLKAKDVYRDPLPDLSGAWEARKDKCTFDTTEKVVDITLFQQNDFSLGVFALVPKQTKILVANGHVIAGLSRTKWRFDLPPDKASRPVKAGILHTANDWAIALAGIGFRTRAGRGFVFEAQGPLRLRVSTLRSGIWLSRQNFEKLRLSLQGYSSKAILRKDDELYFESENGEPIGLLDIVIRLTDTGKYYDIGGRSLVSKKGTFLISPDEKLTNTEIDVGGSFWESLGIEVSSFDEGLSFSRKIHVTMSAITVIKVDRVILEKRVSSIIPALSASLSLLVAGGLVVWIRSRELALHNN